MGDVIKQQGLSLPPQVAKRSLWLGDLAVARVESSRLSGIHTARRVRGERPPQLARAVHPALARAQRALLRRPQSFMQNRDHEPAAVPQAEGFSLKLRVAGEPREHPTV